MLNTHQLQDNKKEFINSLFSILQAYFPGQFQNQASSLTAPLEWVLQNLLDRFIKKTELVSRQEFDIQSQVLLRTRLKIEHLEKELEKLYQIQENLIPVSELNQK